MVYNIVFCHISDTLEDVVNHIEGNKVKSAQGHGDLCLIQWQL